MLPKIHKRLNNVPGRPLISNCAYYTENISAFLDLHLQPLAQAVKSYIKDANDFLKNLHSLLKLPGNIFLFYACDLAEVVLRNNFFKFGKKKH